MRPANYEMLRASLDRGLAVMEGAQVPFDEAVIEITKVGVALSIAELGPRATVEGLRGLADQLDAEFREN